MQRHFPVSAETKISTRWVLFRPKLFEFFCAFLNSDICKFWDLFAAQFTFSEIFLIDFDKKLPTFRSFLTILSHFHKKSNCFGSRNNLQLLSFSERCLLTAQQWQNKGAKIQIISAETLFNFGFGHNMFETRISAEILLHF